MSHLTASAPGKMVLSGEYAVLDGATAICAAVDRRAVVTVLGTDRNHHVIRAPGFSTVAGAFRDGDSGIAWIEGAGEFDLFEHVWRRSLPGPAGHCEFHLDTASFRSGAGGAKIGVGSSAALTVALATALEALGGADATTVAGPAHRDFQLGRGSGVDIASSQSGGVIAFRPGATAVTKIVWPADLHYAVYWSGIAADTRDKIDRYERGPTMDSRRELAEAAGHSARAFESGTSAGILDALRDYRDVLRRFDADYDLGIYAAGHAAVSDAAADIDVVYKPCGAGGGDVGIAVAASAETLASFVGIATELGFARMDMRIDPEGPTLDKNEQP